MHFLPRLIVSVLAFFRLSFFYHVIESVCLPSMRLALRNRGAYVTMIMKSLLCKDFERVFR